MATLDEVATFLASATSLTVGTDLVKSTMPDAPDECLAVYEYAGLAPDYVFGTAAVSIEYPRVQVVVRGEPDDYQTPRAVAETAYRACAAAGHQTLTSTRYLVLQPLQPPFEMRRDEKGRRYVGFNLQVAKELSA